MCSEKIKDTDSVEADSFLSLAVSVFFIGFMLF